MNRLMLVACLLSTGGSQALGAVPTTINYQGRLTTNDATPTPVNGTFDLEFGIWDSQLGGTRLWNEIWTSVAISDGIANLVLGSTVPVPASVFAPGANRWLELTVEGEVLSPRQRITSTPWAMQATGADLLGGVGAASWQRRVTGACLPGSSIQTVDALGSVTCEIDDTGAGVPSGAVMYFNLATCPPGWSDLVVARGRYIVGMPLGGTLLGTSGTALTNLESRPVGQHSHGLTQTPHSHTYTPPVQTGTGSGNSSAKVGTGIQTTADLITISVNNAGPVAGTNAPYVQLLACQKD